MTKDFGKILFRLIDKEFNKIKKEKIKMKKLLEVTDSENRIFKIGDHLSLKPDKWISPPPSNTCVIITLISSELAEIMWDDDNHTKSIEDLQNYNKLYGGFHAGWCSQDIQKTKTLLSVQEIDHILQKNEATLRCVMLAKANQAGWNYIQKGITKKKIDKIITE